jgi:hypothetical protein
MRLKIGNVLFLNLLVRRIVIAQEQSQTTVFWELKLLCRKLLLPLG